MKVFVALFAVFAVAAGQPGQGGIQFPFGITVPNMIPGFQGGLPGFDFSSLINGGGRMFAGQEQGDAMNPLKMVTDVASIAPRLAGNALQRFADGISSFGTNRANFQSNIQPIPGLSGNLGGMTSGQQATYRFSGTGTGQDENAREFLMRNMASQRQNMPIPGPTTTTITLPNGVIMTPNDVQDFQKWQATMKMNQPSPQVTATVIHTPVSEPAVATVTTSTP